MPSMAGLFGQTVAGRLALARLSKATLTELSHVLENMILDHELPATVLTGFQTSRNWAAELARYERMVQPKARNVAVFAAGNLGDDSDVLRFVLDERSRLTQEWFLIVLTDVFSVALFGEDNPEDVPPHEEMDRVFDAAWTFDPQLVGELCDVLVAEVRGDHPDRADVIVDAVAAHPPRSADPGYEQRFHAQVFETLEAGRRRWRRELVRSQDVQDRLQRASQELLRLERLAAIGTTAATLAHELNNPLASIAMTADVIALRADDPTVDPRITQQAAHSIVTMATRAGRMTRGILDLARAGEAEIEPLRLPGWLDRFAEEMVTATHRTVTAACAPDVVVSVDGDRLRHILTNLVNNGLQASDVGQPVAITVVTDDRRATISVRDHGTGIPDGVLAKLFEPFVTTKAGHGGTGLGLALAQRFANDLGSRLELASTGPTGTEFRLAVPLAGVAQDEPAAAVAAPTPRSPDKRRALVIDDDAEVRAILSHLLRQSGWEVWTAAGTDEAVDAVTTRAYDIVLCDFRLSDGRSAPEALAELDAARPGTSARSIVITGSLARELPNDMPAVLLKPFSRAELEAAIGARLGLDD